MSNKKRDQFILSSMLEISKSFIKKDMGPLIIIGAGFQEEDIAVATISNIATDTVRAFLELALHQLPVEGDPGYIAKGDAP
jgi:hypothetical protein